MSRLLDAIRRARTGFRFDPDGDPGPSVQLEGQRVLLVYLFPNLGDVLLICPVVKALINAGAKRVGLVVRKNPSRVLKLLDLSVKLHVLPDDLHLPAEAAGHEAAWATPETTASADEFAATLAAGKYDVAVDLTARADIESRRWVAAAQATHRFGWVTEGELAEDAGLTWGTVDTRYQAERHWSRYQILPLRSLGLNEPAFDLEWKTSDAAVAKAQGLFGEGQGPRILFVPGSQASEKRWPWQRFGEIGARLTRDLAARIVVTGAPNEAELVGAIVQAVGGSTRPYTGRDLAPVSALVHNADLVITNDTAPMHLAFLARRPTVAIFTWMSPICWGPPHQDDRFVVLNAPASSSVAASTWTHLVHQQALHLLGQG